MTHNKAHRRLNLTRPTLPGDADPGASTRAAAVNDDREDNSEANTQNTVSAELAPNEKASPDEWAHGKNGAAKTAAKSKPAAESLDDKASGAATLSGATRGGKQTADVVVRVMAYLSEEEAELLDALWLSFRRHEKRPSKSDILRAALTTAAQDKEELTDAMSKQRSGTLSRQRSSKMK